jgi:hypothetical protein
MSGFKLEIEELLKEAAKRKDTKLEQRARRWIRQLEGF